jgi:hypothetical protein
LSEYNSWGVQELVLLLQVDPQNVVVDVAPGQESKSSPRIAHPHVGILILVLLLLKVDRIPRYKIIASGGVP